MTEPLITKYRPTSLSEVVGHANVVKSLEKAIKDQSARAFLFTGPSGTGKTTLARIVATASGCTPSDIDEIDAATFTGIDDIRAVTANLMYKPLTGGKKALIVDECHALSKQAFQALLKILEEPPDWVYWMLCTTEPAKVPDAVRTRCAAYDLKPVPDKLLGELYDRVAEAEKIDLDGDAADLVIREAKGSPRQLLANMATCATAKSVKDVADLLRSALNNTEAIDLAKALYRRADWPEVQDILARLKETSPESVRHVIRAYMTSVALNSKEESKVGRAIELLDAFSEPFNAHDQMSPLVLACGKICLS